MGGAFSSVLGAAVGVGGVCPLGITIGGVAEELSFSPPFLPPLSPTPPPEISDGGQDKSVGGQFVFSVAPPPPVSLAAAIPPNCVTSLVLLLLLLLSAVAAPAVVTATTTATTAAAAARQRLLIGSGSPRRC